MKPVNKKGDLCPICRKDLSNSRHHTKPRLARRLQGGRRGGKIVWLCRGCHNDIHAKFTNLQLHNTPWEDIMSGVAKPVPKPPSKAYLVQRAGEYFTFTQQDLISIQSQLRAEKIDYCLATKLDAILGQMIDKL